MLHLPNPSDTLCKVLTYWWQECVLPICLAETPLHHILESHKHSQVQACPLKESETKFKLSNENSVWTWKMISLVLFFLKKNNFKTERENAHYKSSERWITSKHGQGRNNSKVQYWCFHSHSIDFCICYSVALMFQCDWLPLGLKHFPHLFHGK